MSAIIVSHLSRSFKIYKKNPGFWGSMSAFFHRKYELTHAVNDVSFSIDEGELVGFIGPNGAGKTTTLKCLSGLLWPSSGKVSVLGFTPFERKTDFLKQITLVMGQKNQLWWDLPAIESFLLAKEIYQIPDGAFRKRLSLLTELLSVTDILQVQVRKLSLGQRMKCELISAILHHPKIIFLDEPTIGLDVVAQQQVREFLAAYNKEEKATILLTSHYMKDVQQLCKRVIVIDHGKILYDGKLADIVKTYRKEKRLRIRFGDKVEKKDLRALGVVREYRFPDVVLDVPIERSNHIAAKLLEEFPVEDLNIEEPDIEEIIRDVFAKPGGLEGNQKE